MPGATQLLDRLTVGSQPRGRVLCVRLGEVFTVFARSFFEDGVPRRPARAAQQDCLVLSPDHISPYRVTGHEGWAHYEEIEEAFRQRNERRRQAGGGTGRKTSPLPAALVFHLPQL